VRKTGLVDDNELAALFEQLKIWSSDYLDAENVVFLERAAKAQRFSDYLLRRAADKRASEIEEA
jgi:hypothetical protein